MILVLLIVELIISVIAMIWSAAMLGFADESHRSMKADFRGKFAVVVCLLLALVPVLTTLWMGKYYFCSGPDGKLFLLGIPLMALALCFPLSMIFVKLYNASYQRRKK